MSDQNAAGSNDRATVALVSEKVDGLRELVRAGFSDTQRQLDKVTNMPERMAAAEERMNAHSARILTLEQAENADKEYSRGPRTANVLSAVSIALLVGHILASYIFGG